MTTIPYIEDNVLMAEIMAIYNDADDGSNWKSQEENKFLIPQNRFRMFNRPSIQYHLSLQIFFKY